MLEGGAQLLAAQPLRALRSPWHVSLIAVQLKTLHSQAVFCSVGAIQGVLQSVPFLFSVSFFFLPLSSNLLCQEAQTISSCPFVDAASSCQRQEPAKEAWTEDE